MRALSLSLALALCVNCMHHLSGCLRHHSDGGQLPKLRSVGLPAGLALCLSMHHIPGSLLPHAAFVLPRSTCGPRIADNAPRPRGGDPGHRVTGSPHV